MENIIDKLFTIMVGDKKVLVECQGVCVSELGGLFLKMKMPNGSNMNVYVCGLYDQTLQEA
jgi:hypothetical protein